MYIPTSFEVTDLATLHTAIERYSFATLVSIDDGEPFATHLPLLLERDTHPQGCLVGHMAKANPQWRAAAERTVLAIFHGPHAYISPTWYAATNVVPTWNYVAVHAYGTLRLETDRDRLLEIVRKYVDFYEASQPSPWSINKTEGDFVDRLLEGIVGFEIPIDRIEGKWKLNQNHDRERRDRVISALQESGRADEREVAEWMVKLQ